MNTLPSPVCVSAMIWFDVFSLFQLILYSLFLCYYICFRLVKVWTITPSSPPLQLWSIFNIQNILFLITRSNKTYHQVCTFMSYTTFATYRPDPDYPSGATEITPVFGEVFVVQSSVFNVAFLCIVACLFIYFVPF